MRHRRCNRAKSDLIELFKDHSVVVELIKDYDRTQSFDPILEQIMALK